MAKRSGESIEQVEVRSRSELRDWLAQHYDQSGSIWLVTYKKSEGPLYIPYGDIVDEALCFGWVDSLPRKLDDRRSMLLLSPRKPRSNWSAINRARVEKLTAAGLMHPAGIAKVEAAKADGRWNFLDEVEALAIPDDLMAELQKYPEALGFFEQFPRSVKRGILEWIVQAKRPETRGKRIAETARLAAENRRANQFQR